MQTELSIMDSLLESRHTTKLQWVEPRQACGQEGNDLDAHITLSATIHDCINMQRVKAKAAGSTLIGKDANHLLDFMSDNWAYVPNDKAGELLCTAAMLLATCHGRLQEELNCREWSADYTQFLADFGRYVQTLPKVGEA